MPKIKPLQNATSFAESFTDFALPENQGLKNGDDAGKFGFSQCFKYEMPESGNTWHKKY